jgi:hypothetical protein
VIILLALCACGKDETTIAVAPSASASVAAPIDHLADGELLEGDAKAFGLTLPRGVKIAHGYDDLIVATGDVPADKVANYVRHRVNQGKITVGASSTVFEGVKTAGAPDLELSVRVEPMNGFEGVRMELRRLTEPKAPVLPDDEARWRAAGLKPNGEPLDPKKLH